MGTPRGEVHLQTVGREGIQGGIYTMVGREGCTGWVYIRVIPLREAYMGGFHLFLPLREAYRRFSPVLHSSGRHMVGNIPLFSPPARK